MATRPGLHQEVIITKALEIADKEGLQNVTMATLARAFHIKSPSLYNHFKGLAEIKKAMAIKALSSLYEAMYQASLTTTDSVERIHRIGKAYIHFAKRYPGTYEASFSAPDPHDREVQEAGEPIVRLTMEALQSFKLNTNVIHAVRGLRSLLHGLVDIEKKGGFNLPEDLEESQEIILETYIKGLGV